MYRSIGRILAAGVLLIAAGQAHAQVVISQVYGGGGNSGATFRSDFIELRNNGNTAVDLSGWSVQYASSGGSSWNRTNLSGTIAPGGYFLIKQADGSGGSVDLPTPDAIGTTAMSSSAGKVALVSSQTALSGACPLGGAVVDFVGFGSAASCSETAPTPNLNNTTAALRAEDGCVDTGNNNADFALGAPAPRNSAVAAFTCGATTAQLSVGDALVDEGDSGTRPIFFTFQLSQPAGAGGVTVQYATADGTATAGSDYVATAASVTIAAGDNSATIRVDVLGDTTIEGDETFLLQVVSVTGADIADGEAEGLIRNDDVAIVPISEIQGSGLLSPYVGATVSTEGIVTARKFNNGFFLQSANDDGNPDTSEGIFVFTGSAPPASATVGNRVRVTGTVAEFLPPSNPNQLSITQLVTPTVQVVSTGEALPAAVELTSADFNAMSTPGSAEKYEAMRVSVASARTISGAEGNISESTGNASSTGVFYVTVPGVERPFREAGIDILDTTPLPAGKNPPRFDGNQERLMVRSRGLIGANPLSLDADAEVTGLVGVLDYFSGTWALLPDPDAAIVVNGGKQPTAVADAGYEDVTISAFNLLRFFDEINDSNGAATIRAEALDKRLTKGALAICDYLKSPDIIGVVEVENLRVLQLLSDRIQATCTNAPLYVPYLVQGNDVGGINVGFLVNTRAVGANARVEVLSVEQYGKNTVLNNPDGSTSLLNDRPPLVLRARVHQDNGASYPVTVIVNHLRSLNDIESNEPGSSGWATAGERVRVKRAQQAVFLAQLIEDLQQANPSERIVALGDFNAFEVNDGYADVMGIIRGEPAAEDQVLTYAASPLTTPLIGGEELIPDPAERYSYVFGGNAQTLDHVLVNEAVVLDAFDIEVDHPRINADFGVFNYATPGVPTRISDHDPVRLRISVPAFRTADLGIVATAPGSVQVGETATFTATVSNAGPSDAAFASVALVFDALLSPSVTAPAGWTCDAPLQDAGATTVTCTVPVLAAGASASFTAEVIAGDTLGGSTLRMVAATTSQVTDPANANNQASAEVAIIANADLSVRLLGGPLFGHVRSGTLAVLVIPVRNDGPDAANATTLSVTGDAPIANAALVGPSGWTCARSGDADSFRIDCTRNAPLAAGRTEFFGFAMIVPPRVGKDTLTINAEVGSSATDADLSDNTASRSFRVIGANRVTPAPVRPTPPGHAW